MRKFLWVLFGAMLLGGVLYFGAGPRLWAADEKDHSDQLAQILKNEEKILQDLQEIKTELVKIRMRAN